MNYIENIYICLTMPLLVAVFCSRKESRASLLFILLGMTASLCAAYISAFLTGVLGADTFSAVTNIAPAVEETLKLLPVLFYLVVFEPGRRRAASGILMTAVGFATFENVCYLTVSDVSDVTYLLIRGAGTGAMHIVCGMVIGMGLIAIWDVAWLKAAGTLALLSLVVVYHAIYNLLVSRSGPVAVAGFLLPVLTAAALLLLDRKLLRQIAQTPAESN